MAPSDFDPEQEPILLFDGFCHLCSRSVQFILSHEKDQQLSFAPLQSPLGQEMIDRIDLEITAETLIYYSQAEAKIYSDAVLACLRHLKAPWNWLIVLRYIPRTLRDTLYHLIAKNRYRWFGRRDSCLVPESRWQHRFLS